MCVINKYKLIYIYACALQSWFLDACNSGGKVCCYFPLIYFPHLDSLLAIAKSASAYL